MSSIGPQLPPHLSKRKRTPEDDGKPGSPPTKHPRNESTANNQDEINLEDSDDDYGPVAPAPAPAPQKPKAIGPSLPAANQDEIDLEASAQAPALQKPTIGPSLPPTNQDEIDLASDSDPDAGPAPPKPAVVGPSAPPSQKASKRPDPESSDDDDYGPALPSASNAPMRAIGPQLPTAEPKPERDSWMLAPPSSSSYSERDPTKIRNRKFASKSASSSGPATVSSIWTETPEEKLRRLQDSVLGREDKTKNAAGPKSSRSKEEEEKQRKIAAKIEAQRGKSLYDEHQAKREKGGKNVEEEDDPSKRAFDREKDMALGGKIGTSQRRELMNKAANFGGRFQKGSFL